jgi:hypothetical protein
MKKKTLIITLCIFNMSLVLQAQKVSYELSAGISSAYFYIDENDKCEMSDSKTGFAGGFAVNFKVGKCLAIQPGLSYVQKGGVEKQDEGATEYSTTLNYIELPVNFVFSKRDRFFWGFGSFAGYGLSGKMKAKSNSSDAVKIKFGNDVQELKPFDAGVNFLIGYRFPGGIFFSLNFANSVSNISNDDLHYLSNGYVGIKAGYSF